jgi:gas vesicle structural protein
MAVERVSGGASLIDVLDRVLDKGIVIDAWVRISLVGIDLVTVEARVVVASIDTYLRFAEQVSTLPSVARPAFETTTTETTIVRSRGRERRAEGPGESETTPPIARPKTRRRRDAGP